MLNYCGYKTLLSRKLLNFYENINRITGISAYFLKIFVQKGLAFDATNNLTATISIMLEKLL